MAGPGRRRAGSVGGNWQASGGLGLIRVLCLVRLLVLALVLEAWAEIDVQAAAPEGRRGCEHARRDEDRVGVERGLREGGVELRPAHGLGDAGNGGGGGGGENRGGAGGEVRDGRGQEHRGRA